MKRPFFPFLLGFLVAISAHDLLADSVELNVVQGDRASFGSAQKWMRQLGSLRSARIRSDARKAARPEAKWVGSTLHVTAVIGSRDELVVPGRKFSIREVSELADWIEEQKAAKNADPADTKDQLFGLSKRDIEVVHSKLRPTVEFSTKEQIASDVLRMIVRSHRLPVKMSGADFRALAETKLSTEWKGYSLGTVMAALLRSSECVLVPSVTDGRIQFRVVDERAATESWPAGWEPELKKDELIPKLFDTLPIDIYDTPVTEVMTAIESRIDTPIIFDEGLFAASDIDPNEVKITLPSMKTFYGKVIRSAAFKAKMTSEVRIDENGKPFYWIAPMVRKSRK